MMLDLFAPPPPPPPPPADPNARRIAHVYRSDNGQVWVFDQHNVEMAEYCGAWADRGAAILRDAPRDLPIR